ncbi:MAG TPA: acyl-CoA dehydrogenase family protein [Microthrixaceae bacterium]|nr:acyl-CoA dehydrogenase family protein [Microthrixaceae bacterium]
MNHSYPTHEVFNQPPPLVDYDVFGADRALVEATANEGGVVDGDDSEFTELGRLAGSFEAQEWGRVANENPPQLRTHDRYGNRIDFVEFHPAYHELMETSFAQGLHAAPWGDVRPGAHVRRAAKIITWYQVDGGHVCPISMTYSSVAALRHEPELAAVLEPLLESRVYDRSYKPMTLKTGISAGMGMTEKQGGSDVRANTTVAKPTSVDGEYILTGHKWFCSAPMSDGFLMLAQAPAGITCVWVPRWRPDGTRNDFQIQRLKDKLGDRSNASAEIEMSSTWARRVGEEGRGVRTIIEMVNHTRLDCSLGSAAIMRQSVAQATWHTHHRKTFGAELDQHQLMQNVLADLVVESEAATVSVMRLARTFDRADDEREQLLARILTPVIKYWTCKRAPHHAAESLECFGGGGFIEESGMPRLFRQSPLNGVWEGSGNVICLDVLRALVKSPESLDVFWDEIEVSSRGDERVREAVRNLQARLMDTSGLEVRARRIVESMALVFQASQLVGKAPTSVADAFCNSRVKGDSGLAFGTLPRGTDLAAIIERARPVLN